MSPGQFGDTTYTKLFVGGLAWETQKEAMKKYFEQFGEILEAVVITDKNTGRSKGYGFVTFKEADAARRACVDPTPVIDGRRANCNLASLGVQRSRPSTPQHGFQGGVGVRVGTAFPAASTFPRYAIQQGFPYNAYGYSPCSPNYPYCTGYYSVYEGTTNQYAVYGSGLTETNSNGNTNLYPYVQYGLGFDYFRYPYHQFYYSTIASSGLPQHPFIHTLPPQPGVSLSMPLTGSTFHATIPHHQSHPNSLRPINSI